MPTSGPQKIAPEEFERLVKQAGLDLTASELKELKPLYELYLPHLNQLRSIDLKAEEIAVEFHPDFPSA